MGDRNQVAQTSPVCHTAGMRKKNDLKQTRSGGSAAGKMLIAFLVTAAVSLLGLAGWRLWRSSGSDQTDQASSQPAADNPAISDPVEQKRFSFVGFGDNLLHDPIFVYHEQDTGNRDFTGIYEPIRLTVQDADLAYINFETICAGDSLGLSGYPMFNGPLEMIDTLSTIGFNVFSAASNHALDRGEEGLAAELNYLSRNYPQIAVTGARSDEARADEPVVIEVNGLRVGLAGFTYGTNGIEQTPGQEWMLDVYTDEAGSIDYELIDRRLNALNAASDVQLVTVHWGQEYQSEPNAQQIELASCLHSRGVEVILGTHPHVLQTAEILTSGDQQTLVYYSLGNLLSAQNRNDTMVGGMAGFDLIYDPATGKTTFENAKLTPTITWISPDLRQYQVMLYKDFSDELAAVHYIPNVEGQDLSRAWIEQYVRQVFGSPKGVQLKLE